MNPLALRAIGALLFVLAIVGAIAGAYIKGRTDGQKIEASAWNKREADITEQVREAEKQNAERVLEAERGAAMRVQAVSADYQRDLRKLTDEKDALLSDVRAGNRRLSIPALCDPPGRDAVPGTGGAASGRDGSARAELSDQASDFLIRLATEADAVTKQLTAAQKVIEACEAMRADRMK